ncbi:extracellular solute-binding protein [Thermocatellispora tengchongensis]|uniref:extracellular solute-binding protein n=1 Tax=Thermocatellispora tengchongensis TaxID=1073253 RepID=UPI00362D1C0E
MTDARFSRRRFLTIGGSAALLAAAGGLTAACGGGGSATGARSATAKVTYPSYIPTTLVKPDLPATPDGVLAGFYRFPDNPVTAFDTKPGEGLGEISVLTNMFNPVPPGVNSNAYWQQLNDRLGATLDITMVPEADYLAKLSTVIASGDLPDIMLLSARLANRADILTRLCADLSGLLSGDAVKAYPFLANIPTDSWATTGYGGGIYAIPIPRAIVGTIMFSRDDLIEERGLSKELSSYDDFLALAKGLTDASKNRWAFGNPKGVIAFVGSMLDVPNKWRVEGGKFVSELEVEGRKEAVARVAEMVKAGLFHPDSAGGKLNLRDLFGNGTIALTPDGYAAWDILADTYRVDVGGLVAPGGKHRGGTPHSPSPPSRRRTRTAYAGC